jgi:metal-sulfur cluster biosynthetic enzyme
MEPADPCGALALEEPPGEALDALAHEVEGDCVEVGQDIERLEDRREEVEQREGEREVVARVQPEGEREVVARVQLEVERQAPEQLELEEEAYDARLSRVAMGSRGGDTARDPDGAHDMLSDGSTPTDPSLPRSAPAANAAAQAPAPGSGDAFSELTLEQVKLALRKVKDPDLNLNIVDLGLVYDVRLVGRDVEIDMSLTSPGCPSGPEIMSDAERTLQGLAGIGTVTINLVWTPFWSPDRIEPRVRAYMGL